jgi:hypothetical protein
MIGGGGFFTWPNPYSNWHNQNGRQEEFEPIWEAKCAPNSEDFDASIQQSENPALATFMGHEMAGICLDEK